MRELTPPEPTLPEPPRRDPWTVWGAMASALLHAGVLALLLWQPPPEPADAAPPPAIDVQLVPPPEPVSADEPPVEEREEEAAAATAPAEATPAESAPAAETTQAEPAAPDETTPAEPEPPAQAAVPASATEESGPERPAGTAANETASEAATAAVEPVQGSEPSAEVAPIPLARPRVRGLTAPASVPDEAVAAVTADSGAVAEGTAAAAPLAEPVQGSEPSAEVAPIPLARPRVRGLTAPASAPDEAVAAVTADTGAMAEGAAPAAPLAEPDVATLELGALHSAERFYLEAMLSVPSMARAREMLETLPTEKRLAQTCNIEALAQVGNAGEGFTPDVVMAEAYARSEVTGTRLAASGAIFRSGEKWYGLAFDCTLSDDLTSVTAFSYRLGADVTDAVLARLSKT